MCDDIPVESRQGQAAISATVLLVQAAFICHQDTQGILSDSKCYTYRHTNTHHSPVCVHTVYIVDLDSVLTLCAETSQLRQL